MIVGSDAAAAGRLGRRLPAPGRRPPAAAAHRPALRPDALPRRRLLRPRGQPGGARGRAGGRRRGPRHAPGRRRSPGRHLEFERIGEVRLKGFDHADRAVRRAAGGRRWLTSCSSACGPPACSRRGPTSSCCCRAGATRSACSTSRSSSGCSARALHVNYGLRAEADDDEAHCRALCERLGVALAVHRATRPDDAPGNLQAWARDVRYAAATELAGGGLVAVGHTASDQAETVLYRLAASPGRRALLGMRAALGPPRAPAARRSRARRPAPGAARAAWPGATTRPTTSGEYARGRVRHGLLAALEAVDPRAAANVVRTAELLREEAEVLDVVVDTALAGRDRISLAVPRRPAAGARAAHRPPAGRGRHRRPVRPRRGAPGRHPGARRRRGAGRRRRGAGGGLGRGAALRGDAAAAGLRVVGGAARPMLTREGLRPSRWRTARVRRNREIRGSWRTVAGSRRRATRSLSLTRRRRTPRRAGLRPIPSAATLPVLRKTCVRSASHAGGGHGGVAARRRGASGGLRRRRAT